MAETAKTFPELLRFYMWKVREPPITVNRLAQELGVARQSVHNWLEGTKPSPEMLPSLSAKLNIPLTTLYRSFGYPVYDDEQVWGVIFNSVQNSADLSQEERERFLGLLREIREREHQMLA